MDRLSLLVDAGHQAPGRASAHARWGLRRVEAFGEVWRAAVASAQDGAAGLASDEPGEVRVAQPSGALHDRREDRRKVERRAADDLQDLADRGLLLERLPRLVEKADVLDGDRGLVGERLHELDLTVAERPDLVARKDHGADPAALLQHRDPEHRLRLRELRDERVAEPLVLAHVRNVDRSGLAQRDAHDAALGSDRPPVALGVALCPLSRQLRSDSRRELAAVREGLELSSLRTRQPTDVRAGQAYRVFQDDVEHGLEVEGRAADGLEDLTDRGLPLEGLFRLVEQPHVLDRDDGLIGEGLEE